MQKQRRQRLAVLLLLGVLTACAHAVYRTEVRETQAPLAERAGAPPAETPRVAPWNERASIPAARVEASAGPVSLSAQLDRGAVIRNGDGTVHLEVTIKTPSRAGIASRSPTDMLVVVDRSGSMSGQKLHFAKEAIRRLIGRLRDDDRLGLVAYETTAQVLIPMSRATWAARSSWLATVDRLEALGTTNMSEGLDLGLDMLERSHQPDRPGRVLLLSDGLANAGDFSPAGLLDRARRAVRAEYVLSTLGIGGDFDERLMTQLASTGTGAFYYLAKLEVLPQFFDGELRTATETYAYGASLRLVPGPGVRIDSVMGLPFHEEGGATVVPLGSLYSGHERTLWLTLRVPATELGDYRLGELSARYRLSDGPHEASLGVLPAVACVDSWDTFLARIHRSVWERAVLDEALNRAQEGLGDAIATGNAADVDRALAQARQHQKLAQSLGSKPVLARLNALESDAVRARNAQVAPAAARASEAKRQKATGYIGRNRDSYVNSEPAFGF